jgi:hypothetical protein
MTVPSLRRLLKLCTAHATCLTNHHASMHFMHAQQASCRRTVRTSALSPPISVVRSEIELLSQGLSYMYGSRLW